MPFLEWNFKLETGIQIIDDQHKNLVEMLNGLYDAMKMGKGKETVDLILQDMKKYTNYHFSTEEKAFAQYDYPKKEEHIIQHTTLIKQVNDLISKQASNKMMISIDVLDFLKSWLHNHILKDDKDYVPFLKDKEIKA